MSTILKCKMCGGDIEVNKDMTIGTCLFCGSTMTLPNIDTDKKARLFNRANQYRMNNEFDKAYDAYKTIIDEDGQEAEAYWGCVLSEYGIEYVDDPKTGRKMPTCHRTHIKSIKESANFQLACKYAGAERLFMYQDEADIIDAISKKILSISVKEKPYDVFICYKESDDRTGERTQDSVIAENIYGELENKGIRTFFARISLEDKLGKDYEPFIFSALNSAKVMIVVSTRREYCNAVWIKNEWSRYLGFMEEDPEKVIIPVYHGMSPYELPDELACFQAQNFEKIGAVQDIVRGVQKLLGTGNTHGVETDVLRSLVEDKKKSDIKKEKAIKVIKYIAIIAIAVTGCILLITYYVIPKSKYNTAQEKYEKSDYIEAAKEFEKINDFSDSEDRIYDCYYQNGMQLLENKDYDSAQKQFEDIIDYSDAKQQSMRCVYLKAMDYADEKQYNKALALLDEIPEYSETENGIKECTYMQAESLYKDGSISNSLGAIKLFHKLGDQGYKDSQEQYEKIAAEFYEQGKDAIRSNDLDRASRIFTVLKAENYKDSQKLYKDIKKAEESLDKFDELVENLDF